MREPTNKDWIALIEALDKSGELQKCAQAIRQRQDRETRMALAEERRERDAAIRPKEVTRCQNK